MAIKQASHPSKVIVSAREGQRARAAALEAIADLNEDIAREDDPDFDPAATHDPEQDVAADAAAPEDQAASDETPGEETGGEEESAEEPAPLTEPPAEEPAPDKQAEAPRKWKLKVNGRELELTEEEVLARAQKVESADQYLAEAARVRHEQNLAPAARSTPATLPHPSDEEDAAMVRAIQVGTEEEAISAIRRLRESASANANQIVSTVDERIGFLQAFDKFRHDYADIMADPLLTNLAFAMDQNLMQNGDRRPYGDRYREIGQLIRTKMRDLAKQFSTNEQVMEQKAQRKRAAPAAPPTAGAKSTATRSAEDDDGPDDETYIRQEAARRARHYGVQ